MDAGGRVIRRLAPDGSVDARTWNLGTTRASRLQRGLHFVRARSDAVRFTTPIFVLD